MIAVRALDLQLAVTIFVALRNKMKHIVSRGHTRPLTEIGFVEDGPEKTLLFSSAHDKTPQVRDGATGDWKGTFHGHKGAVWSMKIDAATRSLAATASGDFTAKLWCAFSGKELHEFKHKHVVKTVDFSLDTHCVATGCQDGFIRIFSTPSPSSPALLEIPLNPPSSTPSPAPDGVTKLCWSTSDRDVLYVGKKSGGMEKWDTRVSGGVVSRVTMGAGGKVFPVMDFHASAAHDTLLVAHNNSVYVYTLSTLQEVGKVDMASPTPTTFHNEGGVALAPDGKSFCAGGADLWLREFSLPSLEAQRIFKGHHGPIRCVSYQPRGGVVASGSEDGTIRLWDLNYNYQLAST